MAERGTRRWYERRRRLDRAALHHHRVRNRRDRGPAHDSAREDDLEAGSSRMTARDYPRIVVPPPGPKARAIVERQDRFASTSYPKEYPLAVARGERAMVEDVDGNRFLDFMAGIAVASTGYGHPKVVKAVQDAAARFLHICGSDFYYESFAALCERLAQLAPGPSKKRVFLSNSGTEAVEGAIKLARHSTGRPAIIGFLGAFHGRTYGGLSLTASKAVQRSGFAPFLPEIHHVPYGYRYRCEYCRGESECTRRCTSWIEDELFAKKVPPDSVAQELLPNVVKMGDRLIGGARKLQDKYAAIGDVRGRGLMVGVEFVKDRDTREPAPDVVREIVDRAFKKGLLLLGCGKSSLRLAPPLVIDEYDVDTALRIIDECLHEMSD